ncbi:hypothetical protein CYMTET_3870 [Cymbomonas tetramitiformis]|uniref:Uncharacterized protein n=1 Tax=Cymbomonas tetramitiformis TaxID=36881 RepID=A0AAE0H290_9CHLO|nr:hypothetical protein CYMTET_3870 [Cymbomonas tetramitiformis]
MTIRARIPMHYIAVDMLFALLETALFIAGLNCVWSTAGSRDVFVLVGCVYVVTATNQIYRYDARHQPWMYNRAHSVHFVFQVLPSILLFIETREYVIIQSLLYFNGIVALLRVCLAGVELYRGDDAVDKPSPTSTNSSDAFEPIFRLHGTDGA